MKTFRTVALAALAVAAACTSISPVRIASGDQCVRCRRTIVNEKLGAELIYKGGLVEKFRGPGCMAKYLAAYPNETAAIYVTDYATGRMFKADRAQFVPVVVDANTGEQEFRAYALKGDAQAVAAENHTQPLAWNDVVAKSRS